MKQILLVILFPLIVTQNVIAQYFIASIRKVDSIVYSSKDKTLPECLLPIYLIRDNETYKVEPCKGIHWAIENTTRFGWLFRHLGSNGSFGDVGQQGVYDANNIWQELGTNNIRSHRIFPINTIIDPATIPTVYTSSNRISQSQSTSNKTGNIGAYLINTTNPGNQYWCSKPISTITAVAPIDISYADDIAQDEITYSEFEEESERFDERWLYAHLASDSNLRNQYPVLNQFYLSRQGTVLDKLYRIDALIQSLADSNTLKNSSGFSSLLNEAKLLNDGISSTELFAITEQRMNNHYFKQLEWGYPALSATDWEDIESIAQECPFVAGNGVYKARTLLSHLNPLRFYNDLNVCNAVGMYKGGSGLFEQEDEELFGNTSNNAILKSLVKEAIKLFPNPSDDVVNVSYKISGLNVGMLQIIDIHGRVCKVIQLPSGDNTIPFSIADLSSGVYTYKFIVNKAILNIGKFVRE